MSLLRGRRVAWSGAAYWKTSKIAWPPQRKKCSCSMTARGSTSRCSVIQSSPGSSWTNGPSEYRYSQPRTSTRKVRACSRSGTVKPMWSTPVRPGRVSATVVLPVSEHDGSDPNSLSEPFEGAQGLAMGSNRCHAGSSGTPGGAAMPQRHPLDPAAPWVDVVATEDDWDAAEPALLTTMYAQLVLMRTFEELVLTLAGEGLVHGPAHSSIGQEGGAVGSVLGLTSEDTVNGSHRGHHQFLAKVLHHVEPKGIDPAAPLSSTTCATCCCARSPRSAGWTAAGATAAAARCTCSGTRRARSAPTPSSAAGSRSLPAPRGRTSRPAPTRSRSPTSATARSTSARPSRPSTSPRPGSCRSASSSRTTGTPCRPPSRRRPASHGCPAAARGSASPAGGSTGWTRSRCTSPCRRCSRTCAAATGPALVEAEVYRYFHQNGPFPGSAFRLPHQG